MGLLVNDMNQSHLRFPTVLIPGFWADIQISILTNILVLINRVIMRNDNLGIYLFFSSLMLVTRCPLILLVAVLKQTELLEFSLSERHKVVLPAGVELASHLHIDGVPETVADLSRPRPSGLQSSFEIDPLSNFLVGPGGDQLPS